MGIVRFHIFGVPVNRDAALKVAAVVLSNQKPKSICCSPADAPLYA